MKEIINNPDQFVDEMVKGILLAHLDQVCTPGDDKCVLVRTGSPTPGRVGIVIDDGSGHLPLFKGYVGKGLYSGVAIGNMFSSPSVQQYTDAAKTVDGGAGVLFLYGSYGGDVFNFNLAIDLLELDGIETRTVLGCDDVASQPRGRAKDHRGVVGIFLAYKVTDAAAERGGNLDGVAAVTQRVVDNVAIMGVGLSLTILPATGATSFDLPEDEMEVDVSIYGEPGIHYGPLGTADKIADQILDSVIPDLGLAEGDHVAVLINGLGATPLEELYLFYRRTHQRLVDLRVVVKRRYIGEYTASLEMISASVSLLEVNDELLELLDASAQSPFFKEA